MTYKDAINYIHGTKKFGSKLGLENIRYLLGLMGDPHKKLNFVHVAGTNGKGSTVSFLTGISMAAGFKTGSYISPYIERFTERICVNRKEIPEEDLARITSMIKRYVGIMVGRGKNHPTEFEIGTAIAMQHFYEEKCDVVVLEVGLGGRHDATNVIEESLVSVITSISRDHMHILGETLPEIAAEKAAIIKENGKVAFYAQDKEVESVFINTANEKNAFWKRADFESINQVDYSEDGQTFDYMDLKDLKIRLLGDHQLKNAALAVTAARMIGGIKEEHIREGLYSTTWPGRMEVLRKEPVFIIDGAHNDDGSKVMMKTLKKYFPKHKKILIFGVLQDKEYMKMIENTVKYADRVITVTPDSERAMNAVELAGLCSKFCEDTVSCSTIEEGVELAINGCAEKCVICAFGSLYYIGIVRKYLRDKK